MTLGIDQAIAEFLSSPPGGLPSFGGLYDDADPANRIIFVAERPPIPTDDPADPGFPSDHETTADLAIVVVADGGGAPQLGIGETTSLNIEVRHPLYETCIATQRAIFELLQENGGQSNGANPLAQGLFRGIKIWRITADSAPTLLGRDDTNGDGRYGTTQAFTVRSKPIVFS